MPRTYVESWFHPVQLIPKGHKQLVYFFQKVQGHVHLESRTSTNPNKDCTKIQHKKVEFEQSEFRVARIIEIYWNILKLYLPKKNLSDFTFPPCFFALKTTCFFSPAAMARQGHWTSWGYGQSGAVAHYWGSRADLLILRLVIPDTMEAIDVLFPLVGWLIEGFEETPFNNR